MTLTADNAQVLALERLEEALLLLEADKFSGAYYLAGYAIELALKAIIAKRFKADAIPDKALVIKTYSHNVKDLIGVAELSEALRQRLDAGDDFAQFWLTASQWSEASRYAIIDEVDATEMVAAVVAPTTGVFQWLKTYF